MKFKQYLKEQNKYKFFNEYLLLLEYLQPLNELSDKNYQLVKKLGVKLGIKVKKSNTLFDYLKSAGTVINDLFRTSCLFLITDVTDNESRKELIRDAKNIIKRIDKKSIFAFLMQLDRGTLGLTGPIRHVLMSFFGLEITSYNTTLNNINYLKKELKHIKQILKKMNLSKEEINSLKSFENLVKNLEGA